jgi:hypothetical protein
MFNTIPTDLLLEFAKTLPTQLKLDLGCLPVYTIKEEYLTDVNVSYEMCDEFGQKYGTHSSVDHPAFAALREALGRSEMIEIQKGWWNGDLVLKPFILNRKRFNTGDQFPCAAAMKNYLKYRAEYEG